MTATAKCSCCKKELPVSDFHKSNRAKNGCNAYCKHCVKKKYGGAHQRNRDLKKNYGITQETFNIMLEAQKGVCAICGRPPSEGKQLNVDHDHETGRVRQLLCHQCNTAIGLLQDNAGVIMKAALYLQKHKG